MPNTESAPQTPASSGKSLTRSRSRRWLRRVLFTLGGLAALLLVAEGAGLLWLRSAEKAALPVLDGELHLAGLSAPVTVERDGHGVPHIAAANQDDLFMAQGYVTAQDRLWQMDAFRRNANGELAEILGSSLVKHDTAQRVLQFRNTARRIYANLPAADRARLEDYARGVNLFIAQHQDALPPEFKLLGYRPQPWTGVDSISIGLTMVQMLDTHWDVKLAREKISADLKNPKLEADLYPVGSWRDHPPTGILLDLSQPHPEPPPTKEEEEDDDRTQTRNAIPHGPQESAVLKGQDSKGQALKGHGFSRAVAAAKQPWALAPEGCSSDLLAANKSLPAASLPAKEIRPSRNASPQGLKPKILSHPVSARLKPCPFKAGGSSASAGGQTVAHEDLAALRATLGLPECSGCTPGSNNWVISGKHTASGKPLLANDMHLGLTEPNIWFMADLRAPGFHAAGVTLPGLPFVIAGHNEHVAWGFTALYADVQDLYIEKLDGKGNYLSHSYDAWKPLSVDHEVIKVREGKDVTLDLQSTEDGPLLNPLFTKETRPIALKWTLYDPALNSLPLYQLNTASNWTEFSAAMSTWDWPTQNVVYSDDQGHIAYQAIGKVPLRPGYGDVFGKPLDRFWGDGWMNLRAEWQGYIPFEAMPNSVDPPSGFVATANSRVTTDKSPYPLALEWVDPYRIERIYKALQGRDGLKPADMIAVQTDIYSEVDQEYAHRFAYAIDHASNADDRLRQAADIMRSWDGRLSTDSVAASLVTQTRWALWPLILEPKLDKDAADYRWSNSNFAEEELVMHGNPDWLPPAYKSWDDLLTEAVRSGMKKGRSTHDVAKWTYGSWNKIDIEHPLARFLPLIGRLAGTGKQPLSGDTTTVKQVGREFGPSQRFTMDWSNIDGSTENIVLGESSDPLSPYYRDQWNDWYEGTTFSLPFTPAAVTAQARHTLRLTP
jgi:penicillin amidase